jgi:hypothetical protein
MLIYQGVLVGVSVGVSDGVGVEVLVGTGVVVTVTGGTVGGTVGGSVTGPGVGGGGSGVSGIQPNENKFGLEKLVNESITSKHTISSAENIASVDCERKTVWSQL